MLTRFCAKDAQKKKKKRLRARRALGSRREDSRRAGDITRRWKRNDETMRSIDINNIAGNCSARAEGTPVTCKVPPHRRAESRLSERCVVGPRARARALSRPPGGCETRRVCMRVRAYLESALRPVAKSKIARNCRETTPWQAASAKNARLPEPGSAIGATRERSRERREIPKVDSLPPFPSLSAKRTVSFLRAPRRATNAQLASHRLGNVFFYR